MSSEGLGYISMLLKLGTLYKPEDMYLKDFPIKDKNQLINYIKYIHRDLTISSETIEYIFSNNFKFNEDPELLSSFSKNELLSKFGINSSLYEKCQSLYNNLLQSIINQGKELNNNNNNNKNINEDIDMKIEKENLKTNEVKQRISDINSLCDDFEKALKVYKIYKKKREDEKKEREEENKMEIENDPNKKNAEKKKVVINGIELVFEKESDCINKIKKYESLF